MVFCGSAWLLHNRWFLPVVALGHGFSYEGVWSLVLDFLVIKFKQLVHFPHFLLLFVLDLVRYIREKGWLKFEGWGIHLYVGMFGAGKTSSLVHDAYAICSRYPQVTVLTNIKLNGFPEATKVLPLNHVSDILHAPDNTLVIIDEIGTVFNSRDFMGGKGVPKILFQHICQCRKRHVEILATTQRWNFLDKQLRDVTDTVTVSKVWCKHPFSRMVTCRVYQARDYDLAYTNPVYQPSMIGSKVYIQTDELRGLYDTEELVETMLASDYVSDEEILANRGEGAVAPVELSKQASRRVRKSKIVVGS